MSRTELKVLKLEKEVELLRSAVVGLVGRDEEGDYRPSFVKRIWQSVRQTPPYEFKDANSFVTHLRKLAL